jgi:elongation factor G
VNNENMGSVLSDLSNQRRGIIKEVSQTMDGSHAVVIAEVPLKEMVGYSTTIRSITQGAASFSMEFSKYDEMAMNEQKATLESMRGFIS